MKKLALFTLSVSAAVICAIIVAVAIMFAVTFNVSQSNGGVTERLPESPSVAEAKLLAVYINSEGIFASAVDILPQSQAVEVRSVNLTDLFDCSPTAALAKNGLYSFLGHILSSLGEPERKYVAVTSENFIKIADRCGGMVYNNSDKEKVLLTGKQLDNILTDNMFSEFCKQASMYALNGKAEQLFNFITQNSENNLSYPEMYNVFKSERIIS